MRISRVREKVKSAAARWRLGRWKTAQIAFAKVFPSIERDPVVDISGCCDITTRSVALPMTDGADTAGEIAVSLFKSETDCSSAVAVRAPAGTPIGEVRCRTAPPRAALLGPAMPLSLHSARRRPAAPPPRGRTQPAPRQVRRAVDVFARAALGHACPMLLRDGRKCSDADAAVLPVPSLAPGKPAPPAARRAPSRRASQAGAPLIAFLRRLKLRRSGPPREPQAGGLPPSLAPASEQRRDETCPVSTEGGTRRVQLVREGGGREGAEQRRLLQRTRGMRRRHGLRRGGASKR